MQTANKARRNQVFFQTLLYSAKNNLELLDAELAVDAAFEALDTGASAFAAVSAGREKVAEVITLRIIQSFVKVES